MHITDHGNANLYWVQKYSSILWHAMTQLLKWTNLIVFQYSIKLFYYIKLEEIIIVVNRPYDQ
jgi:hypothetical protein